MAEIAVKTVIDKLIPLIDEEAKLLRGIHKEVKSIKDELEIIAAFLKEADAREVRGETNDLIKVWVKRVIDVAYRMEDVMDKYLHHVAQQQQTPHRHNNRMRFISFLRKISRYIIKLKPRHDLASEIQEIKENVRDIKNIGNGYGLINSTAQGTSSTSGVQYNPPIASLFVDEAELVGIEAPKHMLLSWLAEEQPDRMVFSLVGMGGVGKTTLAKKVFDSQKGRFDCHAWITISQTYTMKEVLTSLIHQFHRACKESSPSGMDDMNEVMLIEHLHGYVKQKRYLVSFDDIWNMEFWMAMQYVLPDHKNCSRILITTRKDNVAPSSLVSSLNREYLLQPLPFEKAWELFCKKVFPSREDELLYLPQLKELSEVIVHKCEGLPLAIVATGGILSAKPKNVFEWQKLYNGLKSKLEKNENFKTVMKVLSLSYHDLPYHLKPCLLYFGLFPEDYMIRGSRLIRQWLTEGFVKVQGDDIKEDVAQDYLMELVRRNLIQVAAADYSGKAREFRVHDLIRDFIHSKLEEQRFGQTFTKTVSKCLMSGRDRRLSIIDNPDDIFDEKVNIPPVRSVFLFRVSKISNNFIVTLFENFKLLNMLDFENAPMTSLPDEIGNLFHLKYLSIRNTKVERLPKSIEKLQQLETLDMKRSLVRELPIEIKRLHKLRYLVAYCYDYSVDFSMAMTVKGITIHAGLGCMETLHKLSCVEADGSSAIVKELRNFRQLRRLAITKVSRADVMELCSAIQNIDELRSLAIRARNENEVMDLQSIVSPPPFLQRLSLNGKMEILPNWVSKLHNVVRVYLRWCGLADDPLQTLEELPNLMNLEISIDAYIGEQLHFQRGGFKKLKVLNLMHLNALRELIIDEGALSNLENLYVGPSPLLKEVPSGIQHLSKLKHVCFYDMATEFNMSMASEPEEGPNYKLIRHIPEAYVPFKCGPSQHDFHHLKCTRFR